jgi:CAAX prenyl protease-like protein
MKSHPALAFVLPFVLYLLGVTLAAKAGPYYPWAYASVAALVAIACWYLLRGRALFAVHGRIGMPILVGFVGVSLWIFLCELKLEQSIAAYLPEWLRGAERKGFNPFEQLKSPWATWSFIAARLFGIAIIVPIAEELFWRGFLLRWLIGDEWEELSIGTCTPKSFLLVTLLFTAAHPEWFAAAAYCVLLNFYVWKTKDLWGCIVAHATSNFALSIYIMATGSWWLW